MSYTAQNVIKTFMTTLDTTSSTGLAALNEAVAACSTFSSASDWISSFTAACKSALSAGETSAEILSSLCGINLTNTDTGAITGSDAGTSTTKTAESIIAENGTASSPSGTTSTINSLLVTWPTTSYNNGTLTSTEKYIIANLNTWWIPESLSLLTESYGMSFGESGTSVNAINVQFVNEGTSGTLAYTSWYADSSTDKTVSLTLSINMSYYNNINTSDNNGISSTAPNYYLDRVIAHELTHALMAANLNYSTMSKLPLFITEGLAELVGGVDDERSSDISYLISHTSALSSALSLTSDGEYYSYAAGYMALRYLAKYASDGATPSSSDPVLSYNSTNTALSVTTSSSDAIWLDGRTGTSYSSTLTTLDASSSTGSVLLAGGTNSETIIAGSGSTTLWGGYNAADDTLQGGSGTDTFFFGQNEGHDTITSITASSDLLELYNFTAPAAVGRASGSASTLTLTSSSTTSLTIIDAGDSAADTAYRFTSDGSTIEKFKAADYEADTLTYDTNVSYYYGSLSSSTSNTTTIAVTGSSDAQVWFDGRAGKYYNNNISILDGSSATGSITLGGGAGSDTIIGGQGTSTLWGGYDTADDTLEGGSGTDIFFYGNNEGNDCILNGSSTDKIFLYSSGLTISSAAQSGSDLVLTLSTGNTLTLSNWSDSSLNTILLADGTQHRLSQNGSSITW